MESQIKKPLSRLNLKLTPFSSRFFRLAAINILSNLMIPLSGLLSVGFLGHLDNIENLAGVTLATILFNYLYRTLSFLRMGTTGVTAQALGRGDQKEVLLTGLRNALIALTLGVLVLLCQSFLGDLGFSVLSADTGVKAAGQDYYLARIGGVPAALLNFVLIGWFLGQEKSGQVLILSVVGNTANIILDYLLITRWGLGSWGAGLATALSQDIMAFLGIILAIKLINWQDIKEVYKDLFAWQELKQNFLLNRDIFIRTLAFLSTFSIFTNLSSILGTKTLAENALMLQVVTIAVYLVDGLAYATECLVGIYQGENKKNQLLPLLSMAAKTSFVAGLFCASAFILFPDFLFGLLTDHRELVLDMKDYIPWLLPVLGLGSLAFILDGYYLGLAAGATLRNAALLATVLGFAPLACLAWYYQSNTLLWLSMTTFMAARMISLGVQIPHTLKE
jgi:MATE family multidrug resistance protein